MLFVPNVYSQELEPRLVSTLVDTDFDLKAACDAAFDTPGPDIIELPAGVVTITEMCKVPSYTTIRGQGMENTEIFIDISGGPVQAGIDLSGKAHCTFEDFSITHREPTVGYGKSGYAIQGGRGGGWNKTSKYNTFDKVWIHDIRSAGLTNYGGGDHWTVTNCRIERIGRGGFTGNGQHNMIISNCYFGEMGDDGIGLNGDASNNSVTGCYFWKCGAMGSTPAAAVKCHGVANVIDGNTFRDCHTAISLQLTNTIGGGHPSGWGSNQFNIFSDNTVWMCDDKQDFTVGTWDSIAAIKVKNSDHVKITNNYVHMLTPTGRAYCPLWIQRSRNVEMSGNTFAGGMVKFANGGNNENITFHRDTFLCYNQGVEGIDKNVMVQVGHSIGVKNLLFDTCKFDPNFGTYIRSYHSSAVTAKFRNNVLGDSPRIGFPSSIFPNSTYTSIRLMSSPAMGYNGLAGYVAKGKRLLLCKQGLKLPIVSAADQEAGTTQLLIDPIRMPEKFTSSYTWIEYAPSPARGDSVARMYYKAPATATLALTLDGNDIPDIQPTDSVVPVPDPEPEPEPEPDPDPDPVTFEPNPVEWKVKPTPLSTTSLGMEAAEVTSSAGGEIEYAFFAVNGGHDSGYQSSRMYGDNGLEPGKTYTYICHARDKTRPTVGPKFSVPASGTTNSPIGE